MFSPSGLGSSSYFSSQIKDYKDLCCVIGNRNTNNIDIYHRSHSKMAIRKSCEAGIDAQDANMTSITIPQQGQRQLLLKVHQINEVDILGHQV